MSTNATNAANAEVTTDQLLTDLKTVMNDAEALLRATSTQTGEKIQEVRARAEESLRQAKARLSSLEDEALRRAREVADATDEYVRENPWPVSYTHLRAHETPEHLVCRLLLEKKK